MKCWVMIVIVMCLLRCGGGEAEEVANVGFGTDLARCYERCHVNDMSSSSESAGGCPVLQCPKPNCTKVTVTEDYKLNYLNIALDSLQLLLKIKPVKNALLALGALITAGLAWLAVKAIERVGDMLPQVPVAQGGVQEEQQNGDVEEGNGNNVNVLAGLM